jgi:hypothetical protein
MIPCNECIALAACRYKKDIDCQMLFDWIKTCKTREEAVSIIINYIPDWKSARIGDKNSGWIRIALRPMNLNEKESLMITVNGLLCKAWM